MEWPEGWNGLLIDTQALALPEINLAVTADSKRMDFDYKSYLKDASEKTVLLVHTHATSSGLLTNNRVYPGMMVKDSVKTWLTPYQKPVLSRHPERGLFSGGGSEPEVFGRVFEADYIRLIADRLGFREDWKSPATTGRGSGYVELKSKVTDSDAIEKFLDRRFLTLSTGQFTDSLKCSVCGCDWIKDDDWCDHRPGKIYEVKIDNRKRKVKAYHITGMLRYDHWATVNTPANPHAVILGMESKDCEKIFSRDAAEVLPQAKIVSLALTDERGSIDLCLDNEWGKNLEPAVVSVPGVDLPYTPHPEPEQDASDTSNTPGETEESVMSDELKKESEVQDQEPKKEPEKEPEQEPVVDSEKEPEKEPEAEPEVKDEEIPQDAPKADGVPEPTDNDADGDNTPSAEEQADANILGSLAEAKIEFDLDSASMSQEEYDNLLAIDKKLTAAARKKLAASTFCGPDRSFPVPDCSHAYNARARLVHAKLSGSQKAKVRACINRRAKALSCAPPGGKKGDEESQKQPEATPEEVRLMRQVDNLKASLAAKCSEVEGLLDVFSELDEKYRVLLADQVFGMRVKLGKPDTKFDSDEAREKALEDLSVRPLEYLEGVYADLYKEVSADVESRKEEPIEDPTVQQTQDPVLDKKPEKDEKKDDKSMGNDGDKEVNKLLDFTKPQS